MLVNNLCIVYLLNSYGGVPSAGGPGQIVISAALATSADAKFATSCAIKTLHHGRGTCSNGLARLDFRENLRGGGKIFRGGATMISPSFQRVKIKKY